ncbi:hypothetical protein GEMRC1_012804 [Eukaryota sp. GEM-RC1]
MSCNPSACANCPLTCMSGRQTPSEPADKAEITQQPETIEEPLPPIDIENLPVKLPNTGEPAKVVHLVSGGLDSLLVTQLLVNMGLHVIVYHGVHSFEPHGADRQDSSKRLEARLLGMGVKEVVFVETSMQILDFVRNPKFGLGKTKANPCVDCRLNNIREVIGQRPMSQRKEAMNLIDAHIKKMGFDGLIVRPLCAQNLTPTIPERLGWIDRSKLYNFSGRSRKPQMRLAKQLNLGKYPSPGGGCLLTVDNTAQRVLDLLKHETPENPITMTHLDLIAVGRHFRFSPTQTVILARNEVEVNKIHSLAPKHVKYSAYGVSGSMALVFGSIDEKFEIFICGVALYYSKLRESEEGTVARYGGEDEIAFDQGAMLAGKKVSKREDFLDQMIGLNQ